MEGVEIVNYSENEDGSAATVTVVDRQRGLYACHSSFRRGGCLYAGTVTLRNLKAEIGGAKEIDITSRATDSEAHQRYLIGLAEKHVAPLTALLGPKS